MRRVCLVADAGMISKKMIAAVEAHGWFYILGARLRRTKEVRDVVLSDTGAFETVEVERQRPDPMELQVKEVTVNDTPCKGGVKAPHELRRYRQSVSTSAWLVSTTSSAAAAHFAPENAVAADALLRAVTQSRVGGESVRARTPRGPRPRRRSRMRRALRARAPRGLDVRTGGERRGECRGRVLGWYGGLMESRHGGCLCRGETTVAMRASPPSPRCE